MTTSTLATKLRYHLQTLPHIVRTYKNYPQILHAQLRKHPLLRLEFRNGTTFTGNTKSLLLTVAEEIYHNHVYDQPPVSVQPGDIVLDIGANVGIFSVYAAQRGAAQIFAYEPLPDNAVLIKNNLALNAISQAKVVQAAVSDKIGTAKLYLGHLDVGNLLFDHNSVGKLETSIKVETVTLEHILKLHKLTHVDFLKLDCEGSEGAILLNTPKAVWKKIDKIALEFHDNVSALSHGEIVAKLEKLGYATKLISNASDFGYIYAWKD